MADFTIICGGTGGHLTPGIAVAERLIDLGHQPTLVVSRKEVDQKLSKKYDNLSFMSAPGVAFSWSPLKFLKFVYGLLASLAFSWKHLQEQRPSVILAFGGFMSVGFIFVARIQGIPVVLHEANRKPGRTVRVCARFCQRVFLPEGVQLLSLPPRIVKHLGMPLRKELVHIPKDQVRHRFGMQRHEKVLVVVGGSQGAEVLNKWVEEHCDSLAADGINVICVAGPRREEGSVVLRESDLGDPIRLQWIPFCDDMAALFSSADLVLSRAGAGSIAELVACLCPSILIPYPYAADHHQDANASDFERRGGCVLVPQTQINNLYREVTDLIFNDWLLARIRENLRRLSGRDYAMEIAREMERMVKDGGPK